MKSESKTGTADACRRNTLAAACLLCAAGFILAACAGPVDPGLPKAEVGPKKPQQNLARNDNSLTGHDLAGAGKQRIAYLDSQAIIGQEEIAGLVEGGQTDPTKATHINHETKFSSGQYGVAGSPRVTTAKRPRKGGGRYQVGKPYKIKGRWYKPRLNPNLRETGLASWYGPNFHGRLTANGEIYDQYALSAAHPTMPLPSYAYVTNLENGRKIKVRVNDRGPFAPTRVIDLSSRAATLLGYSKKGLARVRVEYAGKARMDGLDEEMLMASYVGPARPDSPAPPTRLAMADADVAGAPQEAINSVFGQPFSKVSLPTARPTLFEGIPLIDGKTNETTQIVYRAAKPLRVPIPANSVSFVDDQSELQQTIAVIKKIKVEYHGLMPTAETVVFLGKLDQEAQKLVSILIDDLDSKPGNHPEHTSLVLPESSANTALERMKRAGLHTAFIQ